MSIMADPFSHDTTSNAQTDHRFADDVGVVPDIHRVSFETAMDAPRDPLAEDDYRYPAGAPSPTQTQAQPEPTAATRPGHYPNGYAP